MAAAAYAMNNGPVAPTNHHSQIQNPISSSLPSLKSFANTPKYLQQNQPNNSGGLKKKVERNSDEYRRRRERNNVAVRKSRESQSSYKGNRRSSQSFIRRERKI